MEHECVIGKWNDYDYSPLVTMNELMEKYNPFKNVNQISEEVVEKEEIKEDKPVEIKKEAWYKKIYNKILSGFGIKK